MSKSVTTDRHANARDRKRAKAREHVVSNRSVFVIQQVIAAKAAEAVANAERAAQAKRKR